MTRLTRINGFLPFVVVVFLNSFVDLGHKIIIQNALFKAYDGPEQIWLTAVVNALILLPFILLFTPSGFIADRWPKNRVMRISAFVAIGITLAITACYYLGWFQAAFAMTFVLALQSAIYSPSKFGYIKELSGNEALTTANAWVQASTSIAILAGTLVFSVLFEALLRTDSGAIGGTGLPPDDILRRIAPVGWCLVLASLTEALLTLRLPEHHAGEADMRFDRAAYLSGRYLKHNLHAAWNNQVIWLSIVGLGVFWGIAQVLLAAFPAFVEDSLGETNTVMIQGVMAFSGIGIILGAMLAGRISRDHVETGLIPVGAMGIALVIILLPHIRVAWLHGLNFLALGFLAGLFIVPLNALIQFNAGERELGRVLAAKNFVLNWVMLAALMVTMASALANAGSHIIMVALGVVATVGGLYTILQLPQSLLRFVIARTMRTRYRLQVIGLDDMPAQDGVLMLGNHVSWIDWAMVQLASPRPVHFVMERGIYERWYLRRFMDAFGVVPISRGRSRDALKAVTRLLNQGEVVCLFPEGTMSKNAQLGEFKRGFERAAAGVHSDRPVRILPFYLRGLWGSRFSHASQKLKRGNRDGLPRDVIVAFGPTLPIHSHADAVKQAVFALSVSSWREHAATLPTLPQAWLRVAKRRLAETAVIDSSGRRMSNRRLIAATLRSARIIRHHCRGPRIGVLLLPSSTAVIANLASWLAGKQVVNLSPNLGSDAFRSASGRAGLAQVLTSAPYLAELRRQGLEPDRLLADLECIDLEALHAAHLDWRGLLALTAAVTLPGWLLLALGGCHRVRPDDTAAVLFSSDPHGWRKGVELSHRTLIANVEQIADVLNTECDDLMLANLPFSQALGLTLNNCLPLLAGMPMICHSEPDDALGAAKAIARFRATLLFGTSRLLEPYLEQPKIHPIMLASLRLLIVGAEPLAPKVREGFALRFNKHVYEGYGTTETSPLASLNLPDAIETEHWTIHTGSKPGSVGMPLPGTCFRVVDPQTFENRATGQDGLVLIGGVQLMKGYLNEPERTREAMIELDGQRWYKTGDCGHLDGDGFLNLTGRQL
ncbi:MFS transporter [Halochromatium salexigens]|uniref:Acyl-[ACP]--phospholipid O-acyltransferase n=1 Tax=Halochromatium salexigens TaxID=49447 RepID=A0AAJ0UH21_HALSE|nr:MFS transporter [Halochromatium salexigens]MBK5931346.1 acyl-[ACP]--phospholipid O-acyltransferase [Halochromatium salexigens]